MISLELKHKLIVKAILNKHLSGEKIAVFGSRATNQHKPWSDLDLCVMGNKPLTLSELGLLREAFSSSDLPMRVDIIDWNNTTPAFRDIIRPSMKMFEY